MVDRIKAVIFDWAGTMVDFGSCAPMQVFSEVFRRFGVDVRDDEARGPMGLPKKEHIRAVCALPRIAAAWHAAHGRPLSDADIDALYAAFVPANADIVADFAEPVPGALAVVDALRDRAIKIGSTTGYTRPIMERLAPAAAAHGYAPDCIVASDDVAAGRPTPLMMYRCFLDLNVWPASLCVKVDDTAPGIAEGRAAGAWTVGVALSGNAVGLAEADLRALEPTAFSAARAAAQAELSAAGADFVIDTVADLLPVIAEIERRLATGIAPGGEDL